MNDTPIICQTEHDTTRGVMTQSMAAGVKVVTDFRAGQITVLRNNEAVNRFPLGNMLLADYEMFILNTARAAQDIQERGADKNDGR